MEKQNKMSTPETETFHSFFQAEEHYRAGDLLQSKGLFGPASTHFKKAARVIHQDFVRAQQFPKSKVAECNVAESNVAQVIELVTVIYPEAWPDVQRLCADSWPENIADVQAAGEVLRPITDELYRAAMNRTTKKKKLEQNLYLRDVGIFVLLFVVLYLGTRFVDALYLKQAPQRVDGSQAHYETFVQLGSQLGDLSTPTPAYWAEFGKNGQLMTERTSYPGVSVTLNNFTIGGAWSRDIYFHIDASNSGRIEVSFTPNSLSHLALFMTDGPTYWRMSRIQSPGADLVAHLLHDGRWYLIPLTGEEQEKGRSEIRISQYTGDSIAVSALAGFNVRK